MYKERDRGGVLFRWRRAETASSQRIVLYSRGTVMNRSDTQREVAPAHDRQSEASAATSGLEDGAVIHDP